jgi:hypothetical protein
MLAPKPFCINFSHPASGEMSALAPAPASGCDQASLRSNRFNAVAMISSGRPPYAASCALAIRLC